VLLNLLSLANKKERNYIGLEFAATPLGSIYQMMRTSNRQIIKSTAN